MAEKWTLKGESIGACNCSSICPCIFGKDPNKNRHCTAFNAFKITSGSFGKTDLSGRRALIAFEWTGNVFEGNIAVGIYVDDGASAEQVKAFEQIFTGKAGGSFEQMSALFGTVKGIKQVPLEINDGRAEAGTMLSSQVTPWTGADQQGPLVVMNSPFDYGGAGLKVGSADGHFVDKDWGFEFEFEYGDLGKVELAS